MLIFTPFYLHIACRFPAKTFDYEGLYKSLGQLSEFEKRANSRVIESGVLKGMNLDDIKRAGERLILQDGCIDFFQKVVKEKENLNVDLHVLSYCWCADLIRSAFSSGKFLLYFPAFPLFRCFCVTICPYSLFNFSVMSF